jgi:hypothetical protein
VDLERRRDFITIPIIVRAEIAGQYGGGWERMEIARAEAAVEQGYEKNKKFDFVLNDFGSISFVRLPKK